MKTRPRSVAVVSLFYIFAACFVGFTALITVFMPEAHFGRQLWARLVTLWLTRHSLVDETWIPILSPFIAAYFAAIGLGLWFLQKWARHLVIVTSGWTVFAWLRALLIGGWALQDPFFQDQFRLGVIYVLITINLAIVAGLAAYPDIAQAFGDQEDD